MMLKRLKADTSGNFAVMLAILAVPIFGAAGLAVDYTKASAWRSQLQERADGMALALASGGPGAGDAAFLAALKKSFPESLPFNGAIVDAELDGEWISAGDYRISASIALPTTIASVLHGGPMRIGVEAVARYRGIVYRYKPPHIAQLDPEAWDYNRIYVYCFDPTWAEDPRMDYGRSQMTAIADNAGGEYEYEMPRCGAGEAMSLRLWNVHEGKYRNDLDRTSYTYDSDTQIVDGVEHYDFGGLRILETVLCNTLEECRPQSQGGIIPEGKNRNPHLSSAPCAPGKFRYYGFEDRPPENGGSDRDYDDIRIIIECPEQIADGVETVRLVR